MDYISSDIFSGKIFEIDALLKFGFEKKRSSFFLEEDILGGRFCVRIKISGGKIFHADVYDKNLNEPSQSKKTADFLRKEFGVGLEFLWKNFPDCAIARRPDNKKWFAAFLTCPENKLGLEGDEKVEILDLRAEQADFCKLDGRRYFPGYHMNKKNWMTLVFDSGIRQSEINSLLKKSFALALKR